VRSKGLLKNSYYIEYSSNKAILINVYGAEESLIISANEYFQKTKKLAMILKKVSGRTLHKVSIW